MTLIRVLEIENFRAVKGLRWLPGAGVNCLIGPGDSGKSTILDAIDYCLGARRSVAFTDADFHELGVDHPIRIAVMLGALDETPMATSWWASMQPPGSWNRSLAPDLRPR
jgi:putative ATP-dependent endonuclease of the OLD family